MTPASEIVAIDVGNSAVKVALVHSDNMDAVAFDFDSGSTSAYRSFSLGSPGWARRICQWVQQHTDGQSLSWWISTVNRSASVPLRRAVDDTFYHGSFNPAWNEIAHDQIPMVAQVDHPSRLGIDRLLGAYAASCHFLVPTVVVDAGSAVTVDFVDLDSFQKPFFAGGAIFPGLRLQTAALASGTEGLEQPKQQTADGKLSETALMNLQNAKGPAMEPGSNTDSAIQLGVIAAVTGGIERLAREFFQVATDRSTGAESSGENEPRIVVTGGDAAQISQYLRIPHDLATNLVCLGILDLASRRCHIPSDGLE